MGDTLSLVLFSGTDDKLQAAAVLTAGAAAVGRPVRIFLQYWALDAFRKDRICDDRGASPEAGDAGAALLRDAYASGLDHWSSVFRQAREIGDVDIQACSLSMDLLKLTPEELDPLVDGIEGVAAFFLNAGDGQIVFI